jgi:hypothetical protein
LVSSEVVSLYLFIVKALGISRVMAEPEENKENPEGEKVNDE